MSAENLCAASRSTLHEEAEVEIKLQAIRIGGIGDHGIPNESLRDTAGLKLKAQARWCRTFNIELPAAPGLAFHRPTNTRWVVTRPGPHETADLEVEAEPKIA